VAEDQKPDLNLAVPEAVRFLQLLGKEPAKTWFRTFKPSCNGASEHQGLDTHWITSKTAAGFNLYAVIGNADAATGKGGGVTDADITGVPALFVEWDDGASIEEQMQRWQVLNLPEPTVMVSTGGKSVHCYWVLDQPMAPADWRPLQKRLIDYCKGDKACCNPSRVMRLPGSIYYDKKTGEPTGQCRIIAATGESYAAEGACYAVFDIDTPLPAPPPLNPVTAAPSRQFEPRSIDEINAASGFIPRRIVDGDTYHESRNALCGCSAALAEAGHTDPDGAALALLGHLWPNESAAAQVLTSTTTREAKSFWAIAKEHGYDTRRHDLKSDQLRPQRSSGKEPPQQQLQRAGEGIDPALDLQGKPKRRQLAPDEVMQLVPQRLGELPRLNIRTNDFEAGGKVYTADDLGRLYLHLSDQKERWPKETTADAVVELAKNRAFDPVEEELNRISETVLPLPIEKWQRLDQHLLGIDDPIAAAFLPQFLVSAVARIYRPGCGVRRSPVLIGPQWRGKTELGKILFGQEHWIENVSDLGKDDLLRLQAGWGVELSEINGITARKDQEALKAFLTATNDVFRAPYGKGVARYQRRCVFWGTSNGPPLRDLSGSTRFVCIVIPDQMLPLDWAIEHRKQLWSRAVAEFRQVPPGDAPWDRATETERLAVQERNANHQELDPWNDAVMSALTIKGKLQPLPVQMSSVFDELEIDIGNRTNGHAGRIRAIAEANGWTLARRRPAAGQEKKQGFWPPNPGHPGHPPGHPSGHPDEASQGKGFQPLGTPGTLNQEFLDEKEGERAGRPPHPSPAVALPVHRRETFTPSGVPGVPSPPNQCQRRGSNDSGGGAQGVPIGVPRVLEWHQKARLLRAADPAMACATLALKLQTELGVTVTGRQVRDLLAPEVKA